MGGSVIELAVFIIRKSLFFKIQSYTLITLLRPEFSEEEEEEERMNVEEEIQKLEEEIHRLGSLQTDGSYKVSLLFFSLSKILLDLESV